MAKRKLDLDDLEDTEPVPHDCVHGIKSISPMKKGRNNDFVEGKCYFNSKSSTSCFIRFMPKQLDALQRMKDEKKPVYFDDIEVTKACRRVYT